MGSATQMIPVEETGSQTRRRRSNRPGNSQANGPQGDETLESGRAALGAAGLTEGASRLRPKVLEPRRSISSGSKTEGARLTLAYRRVEHPLLEEPLSNSPAATTPNAPQATPLHALHAELGAKFVPFAGYDMPVQFPAGIVAEHKHTRALAGLFDVSHMGQVRIDGAGAAAALETLVPGDIGGLAAGASRYTMLTNDAGGILDDLMVTNMGDHLFLVVNASRKAEDLAHLGAGLRGKAEVTALPDRALLALQGPAAVEVLARHAPEAPRLAFMTAALMPVGGLDACVSRSGYTGEDGFEMSLAAADAEAVARLLLGEPEVEPVGLGARDTLRLEAGLCLFGNDLTPRTTPVEAGLLWSISKRRRAEGGYPGAGVVSKQIADGPSVRRVGLKPQGRALAREHTEIKNGGAAVGEVTSGGFGPSLGGPIAMGYVRAAHAKAGSKLTLTIRGSDHAAEVVKLPFVPHRYFRG